MGYKVMITGATGMVGKGVLFECLENDSVSEILAIGRRPTGVSHPKLKELIREDFTNYSDVEEQLKGYDACFYCLGISSAGMKEEEYRRITYDFTLYLARTVLKMNPGMRFIYVSGQGTDSTEKGRIMWARVKGKTENDLLRLGFSKAWMFRPGVIIPEKGIKSRTRLYQFFYDYMMWLIYLIRLIAPGSVVTTTQIGLAMIALLDESQESGIINPSDIQRLAATVSG
ncbi:MAG: epimerase [Bacteroidales bacterium]